MAKENQQMPLKLNLLGPLLLALLVGALASCGARQSAPVSSTGPYAEQLATGRMAFELGDHTGAATILAPLASQSAAATQLLARARHGIAINQLAAAPADPAALRSALDLVFLAIPLALADPALHSELLATQEGLVQLLAVEDARRGLEAQASAGSAPERLVAAARALGQQAELAAGLLPRLPGAEALAAAGLLSAATTIEAQAPGDGRAEALRFCERAAALAPADSLAQACISRLATAPAATAPPASAVGVAAPSPRATPAPARPAAPAPPTYSVAQRKSFEASGNSGQFASCIDVQILGPGGPVSGAVIGINNGEHSFQNQTNADGYTGRCGLGASIWSVVLFWTPASGNVSGTATTVYVNGVAEQRAAVVFQGR